MGREKKSNPAEIRALLNTETKNIIPKILLLHGGIGIQKGLCLFAFSIAREDVGSSLPTDELSGASSSTAAAGAGASIIGGVVGGATNQAGSDKDQSVSTSSIVTPAPTPKSSQPASTASAATPTPTPPTSTPVPGGLVVERSPSAVSDASKSGSDMVSIEKINFDIDDDNSANDSDKDNAGVGK
ncbi:hypothetical protein K0M31_007214 [Melipona bicolor]|uniref:Uncharacterized protein n=1 Tax=Melipona bicolor TaxID=60889 RepID=A0AA40GAZ3_9HYME|nr:hypothetical protein K0M31_007214 [Melipona bicolor]